MIMNGNQAHVTPTRHEQVTITIGFKSREKLKEYSNFIQSNLLRPFYVNSALLQ